MARPSTRLGTGNRQFRRRYPADIKRILDRLGSSFTRPRGWGADGITLSLGTADHRGAKAAHARVQAEVETWFEGLRAGPRRLTHKEMVALAGDAYRRMVEANEDDPGSVEKWLKAEVENLYAEMGTPASRGRASLRIVPTEERKRAGFERLFGKQVDSLLAERALWIDAESRIRLLHEISAATRQGNVLLMQRAQGDYRPDPDATRFPSVPSFAPAAVIRKGSKLTLTVVFEQWEKHPEQQHTAVRTKRRYRGVFDAVSAFLGNPDVREITTGDLQRYVEGRMASETAPLSPRAANDVHKAALSSVLGWAMGKSTVTGVIANPAKGVHIKVVKARALRQKGLTDAEAQRLVSASLAIPNESALPQTMDGARKWAILICFYTGSRIGAVAQLRREDIQEAAEGGSIRFTPEAGEGIKGDARIVPIHPRLIELGLLPFILTANAGPIFYRPGQRRNPQAATAQSDLLARDLAEWAGKIVSAPDLTKVLHAIRHRFMTCCRHAGLEEQYVEALAGHAPGSQNRQYGEFPADVLRRELGKLTVRQIEGAEPVHSNHQTTP